MLGLRTYFHNTFASLRVRNYRLYWAGQGISACGTWMQVVALGWLVLEVTGSGGTLGLVVAAQYVPILLFASMGGAIADRYPKRKVLFITQTLLALLSGTLGIVVLTKIVSLPLIFIFAVLMGLVSAVDNPTRQTFVYELVGKEQLKNAVILSSIQNNLARAVGPAISGVLIATLGIGLCFVANGLSFVAVLVVLSMMDYRQFHTADGHRGRSLRGLTEGWRYVAATPIIRNTLLLFAVVGTLSYEFSVSLPLLGGITFHGGAGAYAALLGAMGVGSVVGGLYAAARKEVSPERLLLQTFLFGLSMLAAAAMPNLPLAIVCMVVVGFFSINVTSMANSTLQLESAPEMRGRVMALWTMAFLGSTPIGGPIVGYVGQYVGPRWGLLLGGLAAALTALVAAGAPRLRELWSVPEDVELETYDAQGIEGTKAP